MNERTVRRLALGAFWLNVVLIPVSLYRIRRPRFMVMRSFRRFVPSRRGPLNTAMSLATVANSVWTMRRCRALAHTLSTKEA